MLGIHRRTKCSSNAAIKSGGIPLLRPFNFLIDGAYLTECALYHGCMQIVPEVLCLTDLIPQLLIHLTLFLHVGFVLFLFFFVFRSVVVDTKSASLQ